MILAFLKLLERSLGAGVVVLVVLGLRLVLRRAPKWVHVALWVLVAVRLLCPNLPQSELSLVPEIPGDMVALEIETLQSPVVSFDIHTSLDYGTLMTEETPDLLNVVAWVWLLGVGIMALYMAVSYGLVWHRVSTAVRLRGNIYRSDRVESPFVLGLFSPRIYLPRNLEPGDIPHVIAHERSHIRRRDHWWKFLGFALLVIHWFNPLLWVGYGVLCRDLELACDERVIRKLNRGQWADYTGTLLKCSVSRRTVAACPLAFGTVGVKARVKSILRYRRPTVWILGATVAVCLTAAVCFLTNPVEAFSPYIITALRGDIDGDGEVEYCTAHEEHIMGLVYEVTFLTVHEEDWNGPLEYKGWVQLPRGDTQFYQEDGEFGLEVLMRDGIRVRYTATPEADGKLAFSRPSRYPAWSLDHGYSERSSTGVTFHIRYFGEASGAITTDGSFTLIRVDTMEERVILESGQSPDGGAQYVVPHLGGVAIRFDWSDTCGELEPGVYSILKTFRCQTPTGEWEKVDTHLTFSIEGGGRKPH